MKKITIKEIAKEAGVSVATVSYVLNNREDQKISEATRKKVLQIVNLLNYTPNQFAQNLATKRSRNIAVKMPLYKGEINNSENLAFINSLSMALLKNKYNLLFLNNEFCENLNNADAIICYDISKTDFFCLGDKNFVPLIAIECLIDDPLFFQIICDYKKIKDEADNYFNNEPYTFILTEPYNQELKTHILNIFKDKVFLSDYNSFKNCIIKTKNVTVITPTVFNIINSENNYNIFYHNTLTEEKFDKILECIEISVNRIKSDKHIITV